MIQVRKRMDHWNVIFNPSAGADSEKEQTLWLSRLGELNFLATSEKGEAFHYARQIRESRGGKILVFGGDGTLNEVINGLAPEFDRIELAVIPGGTGNDFCRGLDIPGDIEDALEALSSGMKPRPVDIGRIRLREEFRYFLNTSTGGFSTLVNRNLNDGTKKNWGSLAYYLSAIKSMPEIQPLELKARFADGTEFEIEVYAWVVANGRYIAGGIPIATEASVDDGLLDLVLIPSLPASQLPSLISEILVDPEKEDSGLVRKQAATIEINTQPPYEFNLDGEIAGSTPVLYEVIPSALKIFQPVLVS